MACVRFCWVTSHCDLEGKGGVHQLAKEALDLEQLANVDVKPLVYSYIQQVVQIKWDVSDKAESCISWNQHQGCGNPKQEYC